MKTQPSDLWNVQQDRLLSFVGVLNPALAIPSKLSKWSRAYLASQDVSEYEDQDALRAEATRLVDSWNRSGRDLAAMMKSDSELAQYISPQRGCSLVSVSFRIAGSGLQMFIGLQSPLQSVDSLTPQEKGIDRARIKFVEFLLNPQHERLSERPCMRCGKYYLKRTARQKVYCSRKCGKDGTAAYSTKLRLHAKHQEKLCVAKKEIRKWMIARTREVDWKHWVSKQPEAKRVELTPKFLTRAVNKGKLTEPTKGGS